MKEKIVVWAVTILAVILLSFGANALIEEKASPTLKYGLGVPALLLGITIICAAYIWKNIMMKRLYEVMKSLPPDERQNFYDGLDSDLKKEMDRLIAKENKQSRG